MGFSNLGIVNRLTLDINRDEKQVGCMCVKICSREFDFNIGEKIENAGTCADKNGHNF